MSNLFVTEYQPINETTSNLTQRFAEDQKQKALWFAYLSGYWKALGRQSLSDRYAQKACYELNKIQATFARFSTPFQFTEWYMGRAQ